MLPVNWLSLRRTTFRLEKPFRAWMVPVKSFPTPLSNLKLLPRSRVSSTEELLRFVGHPPGQVVVVEGEPLQLGEGIARAERKRDRPVNLFPERASTSSLVKPLHLFDAGNAPVSSFLLRSRTLSSVRALKSGMDPVNWLSSSWRCVSLVSVPTHAGSAGGEVVVADPENLECVEGAQIGERSRQRVGRAERDTGDAARLARVAVHTDRFPIDPWASL